MFTVFVCTRGWLNMAHTGFNIASLRGRVFELRYILFWFLYLPSVMLSSNLTFGYRLLGIGTWTGLKTGCCASYLLVGKMLFSQKMIRVSFAHLLPQSFSFKIPRKCQLHRAREPFCEKWDQSIRGQTGEQGDTFTPRAILGINCGLTEMLRPNAFQTTPRRQSAEGREDTAARKPLGSPSRAVSTPTRTGLSENRCDIGIEIHAAVAMHPSVQSCERRHHFKHDFSMTLSFMITDHGSFFLLTV